MEFAQLSDKVKLAIKEIIDVNDPDIYIVSINIIYMSEKVHIQDILLDTPSVNGVHKTAREIAKWKENFIGGSYKSSRVCAKKNWHPPRGSQLFLLEARQKNKSCYYLLLRKNRMYFIVKEEESFHVISKKEISITDLFHA